MGSTRGAGPTRGPDRGGPTRPWTVAHAQVQAEDLDAPTGPVVDESTLHHLGRVLRLRPGQLVCAVDGMGSWRLTRWTGDGRLEPTGEGGHQPRPATGVGVAFVPVKGDRPEMVAQKLTELGVDRIVVTSSARSVVRWEGERARHHLDRLRRVVTEACAQSRRLWRPTVEAVPFGDLVAGGWHLADHDGDAPPDGLRMLVVGPEGGWTDEERAAATEPSVTLGDNVLRAETAAIVAGVVLTTLRRRPR